MNPWKEVAPGIWRNAKSGWFYEDRAGDLVGPFATWEDAEIRYAACNEEA